MNTTLNNPISSSSKGKIKNIINFFKKDKSFNLIIIFLFLIVAITFQLPAYARWIGFLIAAYAAIANDSIQTLGTFIASNKNKPWWLLWIFIAGVFVCTVTYSWINYTGDVSYARLASKGFESTPLSFNYLQVAAPIFLLILTRYKVPVSTTFLILTAFSTSGKSVLSVLSKSLTGYVLAFGIAAVVWLLVSNLINKYFTSDAHPIWRVFQWITTGTLWSVWLMQDAANIAVFLPRQLSILEFICFTIPIVLALGFMLFKGGAKIQQIVDEKSRVTDVRSATLIDFIYAIILFYFKLHSKIPMSTTWVFLGLLAGREVAMSIRNSSSRSIKDAIKLSGKDASLAFLGLFISFVIALCCNDAMRQAILGI